MRLLFKTYYYETLKCCSALLVNSYITMNILNQSTPVVHYSIRSYVSVQILAFI